MVTSKGHLSGTCARGRLPHLQHRLIGLSRDDTSRSGDGVTNTGFHDGNTNTTRWLALFRPLSLSSLSRSRLSFSSSILKLYSIFSSLSLPPLPPVCSLSLLRLSVNPPAPWSSRDFLLRPPLLSALRPGSPGNVTLVHLSPQKGIIIWPLETGACAVPIDSYNNNNTVLALRSPAACQRVASPRLSTFCCVTLAPGSQSPLSVQSAGTPSTLHPSTSDTIPPPIPSTRRKDQIPNS